MNREQIFNLFTEEFLIQIIEVINFDLNKDSLYMKVLCIEEKGTIESYYILHFFNVIAFDYWKAPLDLSNNELELFTDGKEVKPLKEIKKYQNMEFHSDLARKVEDDNSYWSLALISAGFRLSVVFEHATIEKA